ncbi:MAG: hypothetical protein IPL67_19425 [Ignavibacteria bacterium]|nr:hypothetical protein [Ignavibacteria bacterium]
MDKHSKRFSKHELNVILEMTYGSRKRRHSLQLQKTVSPLTAYATGSGADLKSVTFVSSTVGYACGTGGTVVKTTDGGLMVE